MNEIGVINTLKNGGKCFDHVTQFGMDVCQLVSWDMTQATDEIAETVKAESAAACVRVCAMWAGWPGSQEWNFTGGPTTLGLVPKEYRAERVAALKTWADFAVKIGAPAIITHCGFIPENLTDPEYPGVVDAIAEVAGYCNDRGLGFWFETGQETPVVILRTIERIGLPNMGINLDPANLLMYGKGNPIDALAVFGKYVKNIHAKDGMTPTNGKELGAEVPVGEGMVRYPEFMAKLKEIVFDGEFIIEREIAEGAEQNRDILMTVERLKSWL
ncbi:MAG: sugar phosphate isomerase/epimerase family protein [Armatimonadota bacterium]